MGRFSGDYVYELYMKYVDSILNYMTYNDFIFGSKISNIDFSVYAQLGAMYSFDALFPNTGKYDGELHRKDEVIGYIERVEKEIN